MSALAVEPLLNPNEDRFSLFPIQHQSVWDMYLKHRGTYWTPAQLDFSKDIEDWEHKLTDAERDYILTVLAFFNVADGIVNENLALNMMHTVQLPEARCFYGFQIMMENIHAETYSIMIDAFAREPEQKQRALKGVLTYPCVKRKADWALRWLNDKETSFALRLVAFACVEGILFSSSFCSIYWLKKRGLMKGLCESNEYISRDESLHCDFACLLFSMLVNKPTKEEVLAILTEAVEIEKIFAEESIKVRLLGMNSTLMKQYIEHCADMVLYALIGEKHYHTANPFDFMALMSLTTKPNFFERHNTGYVKINSYSQKSTDKSSGSSKLVILDDF
jgi:ribonucleoside-diphosphate reductase subunit M2